MRLYRVSADTSEKEKVFGGLMTAAQGIWLAVGIVITLLLAYALAKVLPAILAILIAFIVGCGVGIPFAFVKVKSHPLMTYLRLKLRFNQQSKYMINTLRYGQELK